jgi:chaperonin cofactor prefoldin
MKKLLIIALVLIPVSTHAFSLDSALQSWKDFIRSKVAGLEASITSKDRQIAELEAQLQACGTTPEPEVVAVEEVDENEEEIKELEDALEELKFVYENELYFDANNDGEVKTVFEYRRYIDDVVYDRKYDGDFWENVDAYRSSKETLRNNIEKAIQNLEIELFDLR